MKVDLNSRERAEWGKDFLKAKSPKAWALKSGENQLGIKSYVKGTSAKHLAFTKPLRNASDARIP